jgi:SAM-dependent methyltransferase
VNPGGKFVATFFERPTSAPSGTQQTHPPGVVTTFAARDPYHYSKADLEFACERLPWRVSFPEETNHPRGQKVACFQRLDASTYRPVEDMISEATGLPAGAAHYRAFVGPPERFDIMSASQFALLFQFGLRDWHSLLDVGCGSLRLGRLAIPFLRAGGYAGLDPNRWLIEDGISYELGQSAVRIKRPQFDYNDRFDCSVFGRKFDFVVAQSILTHTGPDLAEALVASVSENLKTDGVFLFSFIDPDHNPGGLPATNGWHYPECVHYTQTEMQERLSRQGLVSKPLRWHHPGATWMAASRDAATLPDHL